MNSPQDFLKRSFYFISICIIALSACSNDKKATENIPLPEHPRPDFERAEWINLNGYWDFEFDTTDQGEAGEWAKNSKEFSRKILVPFPWGSPLSEVENLGDIAWYKRDISIPEEWEGKRVFLVVGASDWLTKGWIDGQPVGKY